MVQRSAHSKQRAAKDILYTAEFLQNYSPAEMRCISMA